MIRVSRGISWLLVAMFASAAFAIFPDAPKRARSYEGWFVNSYEECPTGTGTTSTNNAPGSACPSVLSDPVCTLGSRGRAKYWLESDSNGSDIEIKVRIRGLSCPDGEVLCVAADLPAVSSEFCSSAGDCTWTQLQDLPLGASCCTVGNGKCKINTSIEEALPGVFSVGRHSVPLGRVTMVRTGPTAQVSLVSGIAPARQSLPPGPRRARYARGNLVNGVTACTATNTTTLGILATSACDPVVPADPTCAFSESGRGSFEIVGARRDIRSKMSLSGLTPGCEGRSLSLTGDLTLSTTDCPIGDCTAEQVVGQELGSCTVSSGKCKFDRSTLSTTSGQTWFVEEEAYSVEIHGVRVDDAAGGNVLAAGLYLRG